MSLTHKQKINLRKLDRTTKIEIMQEFADEIMTIEQYSEVTKIPPRTIYAKFHTPQIGGFELCGHKFTFI